MKDPVKTLIFCCGCDKGVMARLTSGAEIYPHRADLASRPMWKCDDCGNYVGCHWKTPEPTTPLGCIPTPEVRAARNHIHRILDPIWKEGLIGRKRLYEQIAMRMNRDTFHTADLKTISECRRVFRHTQDIRKGLGLGNR